ncbi:MAG: MerR family transcriptional regulator [Deltaproteobacteria bacterium]
MEYRVEELAAEAGLPVDTIRYYQSQSLLPAPRKEGRKAIYGEGHLERLDEIRRLQGEGHTLKVIRRLVTPSRRKADAALRAALTADGGRNDLSRAEVAAESGVPEDLIRAVEDAGLVGTRPGQSAGTYGGEDVELGRAALALLSEGLPLGELLGLAIGHAEHVQRLCERAADVFDQNIRHGTDGAEADGAKVADAVRRMLPAVTTLVAQHFHRTLVSVALARLEASGDEAALATAREAAGGSLEVYWR